MHEVIEAEIKKQIKPRTILQKAQSKHYFKRTRAATLNASIENKLPNELRGCLNGWNEGNDDTFGGFYATHGD